jgi:hypothetical protein
MPCTVYNCQKVTTALFYKLLYGFRMHKWIMLLTHLPILDTLKEGPVNGYRG